MFAEISSLQTLGQLYPHSVVRSCKAELRESFFPRVSLTVWFLVSYGADRIPTDLHHSFASLPSSSSPLPFGL